MVLLMKCELRIVREIQNNDLVARKDCKMTSLATASAQMITFDMSSLVFPCCAPTLVLYQDNDYHINGKQSTCDLHVSIRVILKRQFTAFDSLVECEFFWQTETP